jgi:hypothetical protein
MRKSLIIMSLLLGASFAGGFFKGRHAASALDVASRVLTRATLETSDGGHIQEQVHETLVPFDWSRLESTNLQEYVSNLRGVACPEETITHVIRAELSRRFGPRFTQIASSGNYAKPQVQILDQLRQGAALEREIESIMYDQLNLQRPIRSPGALFTAGQEERIAEAFRLFPRVDIPGI